MFRLTIYVKSVLQLLVLAFLAWLIYTTRGLLFYLITASLIALIAKPFTNLVCGLKIKGRSLPRGLGALLTIVLLFGLISGLLQALLPKLMQEFAFLQTIDFNAAYTNFTNHFAQISTQLSDYEIDISSFEDKLRQTFSAALSIETFEATISGLLGGLGNVAIALFSVVFILFFFLKESYITHYVTSNFFSNRLSEHVGNILPKIKRVLFRYALGLLVQMTGIFLVVFFGLRLAGVHSALVIAVFAAFINLIPYIGPMIAGIFGLFLGLGQAYALDPNFAFGILSLKIIAVFATAQLIDNMVFQPYIFSNSINAHPLEIFIVISIAGLLGGIVGMVIAVPAYSMLRIVAKEFLADSKAVQALTRNV